MKSSIHPIAVFFFSMILLPFTPVQGDSGTAEAEASRAEQQKLLEAAEAIRQEAERSVEQARLAVEAKGQSAQAAEMARIREELNRLHGQLRNVSRQVAQAHRELERAEHIRVRGQEDRAILGVLLGNDGQQGIHIIGVSPDGPADRAGLQQHDVLVSLAGTKLAAKAGGARDTLFEVMQGVRPGDELAAEVLRDGKAMNFMIVAGQREEHAWQSVLRLPEAPVAPGAHNIIVKEIQIPEIDEIELASRIEEINQQLQDFEHRFTGADAETPDFRHELIIDADSFSHIGELAMRDADFWFGLPQARGLELASLNAELGKYFKAQRGVLVIQASTDNAYGLESGDVIQSVDAAEVNSPSDLLRALRDAEPGTDIELDIKRDRRDRKLKAKVPDNRLGLLHLHRPASPAAPAAPPSAD